MKPWQKVQPVQKRSIIHIQISLNVHVRYHLTNRWFCVDKMQQSVPVQHGQPTRAGANYNATYYRTEKICRML